jgi:hypothetical protein
MLLTFLEIIVCLYCLVYLVKCWRIAQAKKFKPVDFQNDIIYQYIQEAHQTVLETIGIDPLSQPVQFQTELNKKIEIVAGKIETLRQRYVETIARDTPYGKTLQNYDFWVKARNSWVVRKKTKLDIVR